MASQGNHLAYNSVFNLLELVISSSETRWAWQNSNSQIFNFNLINSALRNFYWAKSEFSQQMKGMVLSLFVIQCLLLDQRCVELSIKNVQFTFTKWKINVYTGNFIECKFQDKIVRVRPQVCHWCIFCWTSMSRCVMYSNSLPSVSI